MSLPTSGPIGGTGPASLLLRGAIRLYQYLISPLLPANCCRFVPSCSHYGIEAITAHGALTGTVLMLCRLLRCHPWGGSGFDPVPQTPSWRRLVAPCRACEKASDERTA